MKEEIIKDNVNNFTTMSMYDFLDYSIETGYEYRMVGLITPKQRVFDIACKKKNDDYLMLQDLGTEIYGEKRPEQIIDEECIRLYSEGKNLSVEIPKTISQEQLESLQDVLKNIRSFEYDFDRIVYMPNNSREIMREAISKVSTDKKETREEKIIGARLIKDSTKVLKLTNKKR